MLGSWSMKKLLAIMVFSLILSSCGKPIKGTLNKTDSKFWTSLYETETGGSISSHFAFGEKEDQLIRRADNRCTKIDPEYKAINFIKIYKGNLLTSELSQYEYDCGKKD